MKRPLRLPPAQESTRGNHYETRLTTEKCMDPLALP